VWQLEGRTTSQTSQDRTCVSGQTCALAELKGYGLSESDSFLVLDTCGVESGVVPRLGGSYGGQQAGVPPPRRFGRRGSWPRSSGLALLFGWGRG
jgi:hypothetical protein